MANNPITPALDLDRLADLLAKKLASNPATPKLLLDPREAAKALGISERFLRDLERDKKIRARRINSAVRYDLDELRRFVDETRGTTVVVGEQK